jgi:hypothetical protein
MGWHIVWIAGDLLKAGLVHLLTPHSRSFVLPLILIAVLSALISRSVEPRSIYDARLSEQQIMSRQAMREQESDQISVPEASSVGEKRKVEMPCWSERRSWFTPVIGSDKRR